MLRSLWFSASRPWFFPAFLTLFALTAAVASVVIFIPPDQGMVDGVRRIIKVSVVPDEFRHIGNILYYASRSPLAGPVITDLPTGYLWLGEATRFPSYLYYYVMGFPTAVMEAIGIPYSVIIVLLRLVTVACGFLGLVVLRRILRELGMDVTVATWATVAVSLTGRYVWQSAGVSYDIPSTLLFLLFVLACVRVLARRTTIGVLMVWSLAFVTSVTKYTFAPFVVAAAVAITLTLFSRAGSPGGVAARVRASIAQAAEQRARFVSAIALFVVSAALFSERIIGNLVRYGEVEPDCDAVHPASACYKIYDIYRRNTAVRQTMLDDIASGKREAPHFDPLVYTGQWLDAYYQSLFFYRGVGTPWHVPTIILVIGAIAMVVAVIAAILNRSRLVANRRALFVVLLSLLYVAGVYVFNLRTYLNSGEYYAHSGRYLLPVLGFAFAFALLAMRGPWRATRTGSARALWGRTLVAGGGLVLLLALVVTHTPIVAFYAFANDHTWFTGAGYDWTAWAGGFWR